MMLANGLARNAGSMRIIAAATGLHLCFTNIPALKAPTAPGIQVANPKVAVDGQIRLETTPPTNAARGPPRAPKRIRSDGFRKTAADGPWGNRCNADRTMSRVAMAPARVISLVNDNLLDNAASLPVHC
jgi:hypothetical protein